MNWLDIAVLVIIILNIGLGWFRGLISSVTNIISVVFGFVFAKMYYLDLYNYLIERHDLFEKIKIAVSKTFSNIKFPETTEMRNLSPDLLSQKVSDSSYSQIITKRFFESNSFDNLIESNVQNSSEVFSSWLADNILTIISMIVIFVAVFIGVRLIGYLLNKIFELPVLKSVNKLSGFLFGVVKGCFLAMLFVLIIVVIGPLFDNLHIVELLETSKIAIYFYKYNVVMLIFELII